MGRKRTIDRNHTMDAIEAVVKKHGVAGLSIDAVAQEAGISKSSVVYDFQNKSALLAAFVEQKINQKREGIDKALSEVPNGQPDPFLHAMLAFCGKVRNDEDTACAMAITASLSSDDACRALMQARFREDIELVLAETRDPRRARLAWAALHGVMSMEYLDLFTFSPDDRRQILDDIRTFLTQPDE
ncbi:TetR/AcrR family transcriptional regulator [Falsirhodobacter halotolerans]|uniref:TetR/AcrR family transcriptional regulator n=1 Tax=Falsirhodobacter halotolerans TaxID=1146892 RepID=UPI001FD33814|nr:TetR/AcrR family transcriptional regulator [Falsirhodobacter halotolerans]MCJ8138241.1 TetR/AcrR family transcriptional regulator [Falsirhodobacter halotolerans]